MLRIPIIRYACCPTTIVAAVLCSISTAQSIQQNDVILGLGRSDVTTSIQVIRGPREEVGGEFEAAFWDEPFIQSVSLDNLNGLSHNPKGNLLGVNFGAGSDTGGSVFNLATTDTVISDQLIGDTLGLGGSGVSVSRLGGLSISPDNAKIAVMGYDTGRVLVYDYVAGNALGAGASLSGARQTSSMLSQFDTQGTAWLDSNRVLAFNADGRIHEINAATMESRTLASVSTGGGGEVNRSEFTDIEYNPTVSPYVYATYGGFDRDLGESISSLYVLDADNLSLIKSVDLSDSMETFREVSLDADGNLMASQFIGTLEVDPIIELIPDVTDPANLEDNSSIDWHIPTIERASFSGLDVALGLPIELTTKGDFDGNGVLNAIDIDLLTAAVNGADDDPKFDVNDDGAINNEDRRVWVVDLRQTYFGDANMDSVFDDVDFVDVFIAGKYLTGNFAGWADGDWDGNRLFDDQDIVAAFIDGGYLKGERPSAAAVPEPSAIVLMLLGALSLVRRR